uniref:Uncharacterized protein n=1 Tax=Haptolina ericina TaxID=156174 RepID=A0A7S3B115_9EUKA
MVVLRRHLAWSSLSDEPRMSWSSTTSSVIKRRSSVAGSSSAPSKPRRPGNLRAKHRGSGLGARGRRAGRVTVRGGGACRAVRAGDFTRRLPGAFD